MKITRRKQIQKNNFFKKSLIVKIIHFGFFLVLFLTTIKLEKITFCGEKQEL